jgi:hypothetical protein
MSVPIGSDLSVVVVLTGAAFALVILYGLIDWAIRMHRRELVEPLPRIRAPRPRPYLGCITCEAADAVSVQALCRHQSRDHSGGIQW